METSPLTRQERPETFQPKIVQLYQQLFLNAEFEPTEGFWREFFLLPPDRVALGEVIDGITPDQILNIQSLTQAFFSRAIQEGGAESSQTRLHALETLTTFLSHVMTKKFTNPSPDTIAVLAGLDQVDAVMSDFVAMLDSAIRNGKDLDVRRHALEVAIAMVSGGYKTSLISYFMHRDLFPSLMKFANESAANQIFEPFLLLGLLANYNKFEFQNPYQLRLDDFVNEATIVHIVKGVGATCHELRNGYLDVQNDLPEGWSITSFLGLRSKEKQLTPEETREMFAALPSPEAAILLAVYDFIKSNKLFGYNLVACVPEKKHDESPFAAYLSLTSYLLQHAYRTERTSTYAEICLFSLRVMVEDPVLCKQICSDENKRPVRLCRQKAPYLPLIQGDRVPATAIFDIMADAINHNLRRNLDMNLYCHIISILFRLFTYLSSNKTRLSYHWSQLWRTLFSLTRFLTTYSPDFLQNPAVSHLTSSLTDLIAFCISAGDTFLPDPASYDDLYYKVVESGDILKRVKEIYNPTSLDTNASTTSSRSIDVLLSVADHFYSLLFMPEKGKAAAGEEAKESTSSSARKKHLSPKEVHDIIKQGYDTLSIQAEEGLSAWERWREADWRSDLKRVSRCAVDDSKRLIAKRGGQVHGKETNGANGNGNGHGNGKGTEVLNEKA